MYEMIKSIIISGDFKVTDITNKIDVLWVSGDLTDEQRTELRQMITSHLNPGTEAPEEAERYKRLEGRVAKLEEEVKKLKGEPEPEPGEVTVPAWEPWDGIAQEWYSYGDVVEHNTKYWINALKDIMNTWEPGTMGVDERFWKEITKEQAEGILKGELEADEVIEQKELLI